MGKITFDSVKGYSPVNTQSFIWMAEYFFKDGLTEFDLNTQKENDFNLIDKKDLKNFGLIGQGAKLYFDCHNGKFNILGNQYMFLIRIKGIDYIVNDLLYNVKDIITYKRAEAIAGFTSQELDSKIVGYYFGYKTKLKIQDVNFNIKPIISILEGKPLFLDLTISCDKDLDTFFTVYHINRKRRFELPVSLKKNRNIRLHWNVQQ